MSNHKLFASKYQDTFNVNKYFVFIEIFEKCNGKEDIYLPWASIN